jgi:UMF1 family MFS transporter
MTFKAFDREAKGWIFDAMGRGAAVMGFIFLSSGILAIANQVADSTCEEILPNTNNNSNFTIQIPCQFNPMNASDGCIHGQTVCTPGNLPNTGIKASTVLTLMNTVNSFISACFMPILGAIVDHTKYRWQIAFYSMVFLVFGNAFQSVFLTKELFYPIIILQVIGTWAFTCHVITSFAYLPELTNDMIVRTDINKYSNVTLHLTQVVGIFLVLILGGVMSIGDDDIKMAKMAQGVTAVFTGAVFSYVWLGMMKKRPALHEMKENEGYLTKGFMQLKSTFARLGSDYRPMKWFLIAIVFTEAAIQAFISIAISFTSLQLKMSAGEIGLLMGIVLMFAVPGSFIFAKVTKKFGPIKSFMGMCVYWGLIELLAVFFVTDETQKTNAFFFGILWGLGFGWQFPVERDTFVKMIPGGQETEMVSERVGGLPKVRNDRPNPTSSFCSAQMGLLIFFGAALAWLPSLIFSVLVNYGFSMSMGFLVVPVFYTVAFVIVVVKVQPKYEQVCEISALTRETTSERNTNRSSVGVEVVEVVETL